MVINNIVVCISKACDTANRNVDIDFAVGWLWFQEVEVIRHSFWTWAPGRRKDLY